MPVTISDEGFSEQVKIVADKILAAFQLSTFDCTPRFVGNG